VKDVISSLKADAMNSRETNMQASEQGARMLKFLVFFWINYAVFDIVGKTISSKNKSMNN
jgi:hypothetical protein